MPILLCTASDGASIRVEPVTPEAVRGFCELRHYVLSVIHAQPCKLLLDEVELAPAQHGTSNSWAWQPGFYAGTVLAELHAPDNQVLAKYRLDVSPDPNKLGQEDFQSMLNQLFEFEPGLLVGSEAAQFGIGTEGEITDPGLEYARLRRYGSQLCEALRLLTSRPLPQLHHERALVSAHQVRRLDPQSMIALAKQSRAIGRLRGEIPENGSSPLLFDVPRSREGLDTPAHRTLLRIVRAVLRRTQMVNDVLNRSAKSEEPSATRTALAPRLAYRHAYLSALESALKQAIKRSPFNEVTRQEVSAAGLNTIAAHPIYARVFRSCSNILRPGIAGNGDELLWMSPTWEIYERWCFLKAHEAIKSVFPSLEWERHFPTSREDCVVFTSTQGDLTVSLYLQPRFPAIDQPAWRSFRSLSAERQPDIALTLACGSKKSLLVFDAKYRSSRKGVLEAMQSAHIYHDCLRWGDIAPTTSLLFVPAAGGVPGLETEDYRQKYSLGVVQLSQTTNTAVLGKIIATALGIPLQESDFVLHTEATL